MLNIGIVGTGIAGLTAGWLLARSGASVTLFERHSELGLDVHSIGIPGPESRTANRSHPAIGEVPIDVPPRMFNQSLWPNLFRLYQTLGVEMTPVEPSKSFGVFGQNTIFRLGRKYRPPFSVSRLFRPSTRKILKDINRLAKDAPIFLKASTDETLREFLTRHRYSRNFVDHFLYPSLSSTVCTCSYDRLDAYPASVLLPTMLKLIRPEGLFRTLHGTRDVAKRLAAPIPNVRLGVSVSSATQKGEVVEVVTNADRRLTFDHLILATESNAAVRIVGGLTPAERAVLLSFSSEEISVVIHTDPELMPARKSDWSNFNLISNEDRSAAMCSIWMNRFYSEREFSKPVFQTIMPIRAPREELVIHHATMRRAVVDRLSLGGIVNLQRLHDEPDRRIWFCGSYASAGTPLLESGVVSSIKIAKRLGGVPSDMFAA